MGEETATDTTMDKTDMTKFNKYCQRHGINSNLIMLKITLFVMYGGKKKKRHLKDVALN